MFRYYGKFMRAYITLENNNLSSKNKTKCNKSVTTIKKKSKYHQKCEKKVCKINLFCNLYVI